MTSVNSATFLNSLDGIPVTQKQSVHVSNMRWSLGAEGHGPITLRSVSKLNFIVNGLCGNAAVISRVPGDADVALLPPIGRPCILHNPIFLSILCLPIPGHARHIQHHSRDCRRSVLRHCWFCRSIPTSLASQGEHDTPRKMPEAHSFRRRYH